MKRLAAILFLCIMLFNLFGYRLVIHYLHSKSTEQLSVQIDTNDYDRSALISLKTPLSLPYYTNTEIYERVDGVINIDGEYYNYVMRRIFNDSLELLCLPNTTKAKLDKAEAAFSKSAANSGAAEKSSKKPIVVKNVLPEYCDDKVYSGSLLVKDAATHRFSSFSFHIPYTYLAVMTPPPDIMHEKA